MSSVPLGLAPGAHAMPHDAPFRPIAVGYRLPGDSWTTGRLDEISSRSGALPQVVTERRGDDGYRIVVTKVGAEAVEVVFPLPSSARVYGGGEQFEALDLRGRSTRYYVENFGSRGGTYLPIPWIATTLGYSILLTSETPAVFHLGAPSDPGVFRIQVESDGLELILQLGDLPRLHAGLMAWIGPPRMPDEAFFGLWKAGDWLAENAKTVAADAAGFKSMHLPLGIKLIDAYWEDELHSFTFNLRKYPAPWTMVKELAAEGTQIYLWLCPWVIADTRSFEEAKARGYLIADRSGELITLRPGANPNVVAALIDFSNRGARNWWSGGLRGLLQRGIAGFKVDFGEQLPERTVLASGETGGSAHNAYVRHYLQATIDAFDEKMPAIISRSGSPSIRTPMWTGDHTSDFCPRTGLPSAIRAVQSASLSGWSFIGSDIGGYRGQPLPQVFARWTQFACFTPLMKLHGHGCREPWDMDPASKAIYARYAALHLALLPVFARYGRLAAGGGPPIIRMMPYAFPEIDWPSINDWDQQFMLGDDVLVAPVAFQIDTRAVYLPPGDWFDVLAQEWTAGPAWRVHEVPADAIPIFIRRGARLPLATDHAARRVVVMIFEPLDTGVSMELDQKALAAIAVEGDWTVDAAGIVGGAGRIRGADPARSATLAEEVGTGDWFGTDVAFFTFDAASRMEVSFSASA